MSVPWRRRAFVPVLTAALLIAAPAAAQNNSTAPAEVPPPPAPRTDTVGPEQLRDFSLPGTTTRPAQPQPQPQRTSPATQPAAQTPASQRPEPRATTQRPVDEPVRATTTARPAESLTPAPAPQGTERQASASPAPSLSLDLPPPTRADQVGFGAAPVTTDSLPQPPASADVDELAGSTLPMWPWLLAAALAIGAAFLWLRRRRGEQQTGDYGKLAFAGVAAAPAPAPAPAPKPTPAPPPLRPAGESPPAAPPVRPAAEVPPSRPAPVGIVSSRLRPWIDLEFAPVRAVLTDTEALIEFDVLVVNSGSVPARDVVVEAVILNAGAEQDKDLAAFFARPEAPGQGIEVIPPLGRMPLRSQVRLPRESIREYAVEGRRLFVPVLAFNAAYRWSGGSGRTSASFLVGRGGEGSEKLGPLRVDQGPREWAGLSARPLPDQVRR